MAAASQKEILQAVWRKSFRTGEPVRIRCKDKSSATRLRFSLYNAVKAVRNGREIGDQELKDAVEGCSVGFDEEDASIVVVRAKVLTELMEDLQELVGDALQPASSPADPEALEMQAMAERAMRKVQEQEKADTPLPDFTERKTPYYTR